MKCMADKSIVGTLRLHPWQQRSARLKFRCSDVACFLFVLLLVLAAPLLSTSAAAAESSGAPLQLKADVSQPYIVKKGDTLWDIADHFFRDPMRWLNIWEHNLYITNPDLIYPGNKIWFDGTRIAQGGLTRVQPKPQVIVGPVQRLEGRSDSSVLLTALQRQGFIQPERIQGVGHIIDSRDDRLNFGVRDSLYLTLNSPAQAGAQFDVFRSTETLRDPETGDALGVLIMHLGRVRIESEQAGVYRATVTRAFEEISRGDRLMPARKIDQHVIPSLPETSMQGRVLYIRSGSNEAAQHQVIGINLGQIRGVKPGMQFSIYRRGRVVSDHVKDEAVALPEEKTGTLLVLAAQPKASIALITTSNAPVNIGDVIRSGPGQRAQR